MKPLILLLFGMLSFMFACIKPFDTPAIASEDALLVVDGIINLDTTTVIKLSRTRNLNDTSLISETNARVLIEKESGGTFSLTNMNNGSYQLANTILTPGNKYRLHITIQQKAYVSAFVEMKITPPIDSLEWDQADDVFVYVNTHDPQNKTKYYRWDFVETAEYHTAYDSHLDFNENDELIFIEPKDYRYTCFSTFNSADVLLSSTNTLGSDVVSRKQIARVPNDNTKMSVRYSILVSQYALTPEAYRYWQLLKKNSEETGGLFDGQPSELKGNIYCTTNLSEVVLGFLSASSVTSKRLFIANNELTGRKPITEDEICNATLVYDLSFIPSLLLEQPYLPAYFAGGILAVAPAYCVDCRLKGGVTEKPSFW